ncbi:peptidase C48, SUMO/sentrin/Ubl1 [Tanacetum coccineum]
MGLKSKYVKKTVNPAVELTKDEELLGRSIFSTQEEEEEEVFNDDESIILFRMNIKSLAPGLEIDTSVIDAYVSILNYEEKFKMTNMKRHFFYTSMMVPGILKDKTKEIEKKIDAQYDRSVFGRHLLMYQNTNEDNILTGSKKATNLRMKWKTTKEKIDCGLYMIMHMELYEGSTAAQWKTGLLPEKDKNHRMQMDNLRSRIAAKILLLEVNIHQKKMSDYAKR